MIILLVIILALFVLDWWIVDKYIKNSEKERVLTYLFFLFAVNYIPLWLSQIISEWIYEINADSMILPVFWLSPAWNLMIDVFYYLISLSYYLFWTFGGIAWLVSYSSSKMNDRIISCIFAVANAISFLIYQIFSEDKSIFLLYYAYFLMFIFTWVFNCDLPGTSYRLLLIFVWYDSLFVINTLLAIKTIFWPKSGWIDILKCICSIVSYIGITFIILIFFLICFIALYDHLQIIFKEFIERFGRVQALEKNFLKIIKAYGLFVGFIVEMILSNILINWLFGEEIWVLKEGLFLIGAGGYGYLLLLLDEDQQIESIFSNMIGVWFQGWLVKKLIKILIFEG